MPVDHLVLKPSTSIQVLSMLRFAQPNDYPAIAALWRLAWGSANPQASHLEPLEHWLARARDEFTPPNRTLVYETAASGILAFMVLHVEDAYLHQLFVQPSVHRNGIGSDLIRHIGQLCPAGWSLHVATSNKGARSFYEHHGLIQGVASLNPTTGRERLAYSWRPQHLADNPHTASVTAESVAAGQSVVGLFGRKV